MKFHFSIFLFTISMFSSFQIWGAENIAYKGVGLGVSEEYFLQKFKSDNFDCKENNFGVGRVCESTTASYAGFQPQKTVVNFTRGQLVFIDIDFSIGNDKSIFSGVLRNTNLKDAIESKYGEPLEIKNSSESFTETHRWRDGKGQEIKLFRSYPANAGDEIHIYFTSDRGNEIFNSESRVQSIKRKEKRSKDM